jgi:hypothetical protein
MALQNTLKTTKSFPSDKTPFDPTEVDISKMDTSDLMGYQNKLLQEELKATKELGEKEVAYETAKAKQMQPVIQAEVAAKRAAETGYETEANKMQDLEFKPTQESLMSMAGIASLTAMVGLMLGKTGGFSGQSAIDSMTGMLKGYQQGKADIFKQEQAKFEKDVQAQKANLEKLKNKLEIAMKKAATDREGAEADVAVLLAEQYGADYLKAKYNKEGLQGLIKGVQQAITASQKRDELMQKVGIKAGKLKDKDQAAFNIRNTLIPSLEEGIKTLDRLEKDGQWTLMTSLLAIDSRAAELAFRKDPEALNLIRTFAKFRSKEFETAGKALTTREDLILKPLYQATFRTYEGTRNAMQEGLDEMKTEQSNLVNQYPQLTKSQVTVSGAPETSEILKSDTKDQTYKTRDDVKTAVENGLITREQGLKILRDQFKMK